MSVRLLAIGDIHLGRRLTRVPEAVTQFATIAELSPEGAWDRTCEFAVAQEVDAVVLAGDVVDREQDLFEAYGLLERGVRKLVEAGIRVISIAGNHDVEVLPRLAEAVPGFQLLGRDGAWETCRVSSRRGDESVQLLGWSFPSPQVTESPLRALPGSMAQQLPAQPEITIGLLHCDLGRRTSPHAPVSLRELEDVPVDAWLLGHIHTPSPLATMPRPIGYLGSLTGLDPTESGEHGPWLVDAASEGVTLRQVPLAPLRWERLAIPCDGKDALLDRSIEEWFDDVLLVQAVDAATARLTASTGQTLRQREDVIRPRALGCRLEITGRTNRRGEILGYLERYGLERLCVERDGTYCFFDRVDVATTPAVSLRRLSLSHDPIGLLASTLLLLERPPDDAERRALIADAIARAEAVDQHARYRGLAAAIDPVDEDRIVEELQAAGWRGIEALLSQTMPESAGVPGDDRENI